MSWNSPRFKRVLSSSHRSGMGICGERGDENGLFFWKHVTFIKKLCLVLGELGPKGSSRGVKESQPLRAFMMFMETYGNGYKMVIGRHCRGGATRCIHTLGLLALSVAVVGTAMRGTCVLRIATTSNPGHRGNNVGFRLVRTR